MATSLPDFPAENYVAKWNLKRPFGVARTVRSGNDLILEKRYDKFKQR